MEADNPNALEDETQEQGFFREILDWFRYRFRELQFAEQINIVLALFIAVLTLINVLTTVVSTGVAGVALYQVKVSGDDTERQTDKLIVTSAIQAIAADRNAFASERNATASEKNATAASSFATTAKNINTQTRLAVEQFKALA